MSAFAREKVKTLRRRIDWLEKLLVNYEGRNPTPAKRELSALKYAVEVLEGARAVPDLTTRSPDDATG